ncbi:recombinase family protein [Mycobacteroides abscessus]|uniref:recombinase family protein n=1 Tax=Mycobacteroides abscessus TaxID=36809 RepID=UPI0009297F40|nr:recombinase family protein [Mycobacteroides abscessus]SHX38007.1 prophage integrase [Mycobacteroides abscessus subsp. abscessus]SII51474.1 prophage integrase [Mycobacteroides abscessus subsp. abscessus]
MKPYDITATMFGTPTEDATVEVKDAVSLLRVSSKRQMDTAIDIDPDGLSIATQRRVVELKANSVGTRVVKEFLEPGYSAKTIDERPIFKELLHYLNTHPNIGFVIVYMRSRAFRNQYDAAMVQMHLQKRGIRLISAKEDFGEGPYAEAMEGMVDIMNGLTNKLQGLDIQTKMYEKARHGGTNGQARLGYLNVRDVYDGKPFNTVRLDPKRAPLVKKAWELYATGDYTLERVADTMTDLGLTARANRRCPERPVSYKWYHRMFKDIYYLGFITYKGKGEQTQIFPGRHEPLIEQELFDRVQDVLNQRSRKGQRDRIHQHYLKGHLFCARCERHGRTSRLIYTEAKSRNGSYYGYFMCRARQDKLGCDLPLLPVELVEDTITDHYHTLALPADFIDSVRELLSQTLADEQGSVRTMHAQLAKRIKDLDQKEERLIDLAADDSLPQDKIRIRLRRIQSDRASAQAGLLSTTAELNTGADILKSALAALSNPASYYQLADDTTRRFMNQTFYTKFLLDDEGVVDHCLNPPFDDFHQAKAAWNTTKPATLTDYLNAHPPQTQKRLPSRETPSHNLEPTLAGIVSVPGLSTASMVELRGIEPLTFSMRTSVTRGYSSSSCHFSR